jgi:putative ABC transport system permease protein
VHFNVTLNYYLNGLRFRDILTLASDGMRERKFRFALNLIGILIGCAAISSLVSITQGMNEEIRGQLEIFGPTNIMIIPGQIQPGRGLLSTSLNWRDLDLISKIPHVDVATPIIGDKFCTVNVRGREIQTFVYGVQPEYFHVFKNYEIEEGRAIVRSDNAVAVLGSLVAKPRGEDEPLVEVSDRIQLQVIVAGEEKSMSFRVVGILKEIGGTFGSEDDNAITIPYRMCQQLFEIGGEIEYIATMVDAVEEVDGVVERIEEVFDESVMVMSFDTIRNLVGDVLGTIEAVLAGLEPLKLFLRVLPLLAL